MKWMLICTAIFATPLTWANPSGAQVIHGEAQFSTPLTHALHVHTTDPTLIIHWNDFSIQAHELTRFIQPSEHAVVLNRVTGNAPSNIFGALQANGTLLLLNQNGILFGENATIHVGSLIASTLNLTDEDFLKGDTFHFKGSSSSTLINHGTLHAAHGDVTLLSRHILNDGTIQSPSGKTTLVAASDVLLKPHDKNHILIRPDITEEPLEEGLLQLGHIQAIETHLLADGNLYDLAIQSDGTIDAHTFQEEGGRILLRADSGTLAIGGTLKAPRGTLTVSAENILVLDPSHLTVSDPHQGGTLSLHSTAFTFVAESALLEASALKQGQGGEILCFSEGTTLFLGHGETRGGLLGGHGGFIEVSGKDAIIFHGTTDRFAPFEDNGTLLIDPEANFKISTAYDYNYDSLLSLKKPTADLANLSIDTLIAELQNGPVTIQTAFEGHADTPGHILLHSDVFHTYSSPYTLTFESTGAEGIIWNGSLTNTGTGDITLLASQGDVLITPVDQAKPAFIQTHGNLSIGTPDQPIQGSLLLEGALYQYAGLNTKGKGNIDIHTQKGLTLTSDQYAPAFIQVENGNATINTPDTLLLHGRSDAAAEIRSHGKGNITIQGPESIQLFGESGPALISFSHRYGSLHLSDIPNGMELHGLMGRAAIEGGIGSLNFTRIGSDIVLFADQSSASISSYGPITLHTLGDILLDGLICEATITSQQLLHLKTEKDLMLTADYGTASLVSPIGMNIHAQGDILLSGTPHGETYIQSPNSHIFAGLNLELFTRTTLSGKNGPLVLTIGNDLLMSNPLNHISPSITASDLQVTVGCDLHMQNASTLSATQGSLRLSVGENAYLDQSSQLYSQVGPLIATSLQGNIHLAQNSEVLSESSSVTLAAGKSIIFDGFSKAKSRGPEGMTLIVDQLYPSSIGEGGLILGSNASLDTSHAPLEIFTAKRSSNSIKGTLNGYRLEASPHYVNTKEEQWGIYFPTPSNSATPFTVFHKENGLIQIGSQGVTHQQFIRMAINFTGPFTTELFRDLHPYNEYTAEAISFTVTYPEEAATQVEPFSIKRPTFPRRETKYINN